LDSLSSFILLASLAAAGALAGFVVPRRTISGLRSFLLALVPAGGALLIPVFC
jgi:hypothetical protein